jgi:hypothetical protein
MGTQMRTLFNIFCVAGLDLCNPVDSWNPYQCSVLSAAFVICQELLCSLNLATWPWCIAPTNLIPLFCVSDMFSNASIWFFFFFLKDILS